MATDKHFRYWTEASPNMMQILRGARSRVSSRRSSPFFTLSKTSSGWNNNFAGMLTENTIARRRGSLAVPRKDIPVKRPQSSYQTAKSSLNNYNFKKKLGKGAYSVVRHAVNKLSQKEYAIKTYKKASLFDPMKKISLNNEILALKTLDHQNIVQLVEVIRTSTHTHLVLELIHGKSLKEYRNAPVVQILGLFQQIVSGVAYCHSQHIVHRDLKLDNILVDSTNTIKIIDFGFACRAPGMQVFCGTPNYMAPEIIQRSKHKGKPADIWSLGVILYALATGELPFKGSNNESLYRAIKRGYFFYNVPVHQAIENLLSRILQVDPNTRPNAEELMRLCEAAIYSINSPK